MDLENYFVITNYDIIPPIPPIRNDWLLWYSWVQNWPVAFFDKDVYPRLAKRLLNINGRLANRGLTSLVKRPLVSNVSG